MKNWKELSVLIVGCGSIGKRHTRVLSSLGVKDIRVCDPAPDQLASLLSESPHARVVESFEAGLSEGVDTAFILTPPKMHIPMAIQALEAGSNVFSEKPLSDSLDGFDELERVLKKTGLKMMVGLCFRFHEGLNLAKRLLEEGKIGRLAGFRALVGEHFPAVRSDYKTLFTARYSGAFDMSHEVDLACWFVGDRGFKSVKSLYGNFSDIGIDAPDMASMLIEFEESCFANVHLDFFQIPRRRQTELIGTQGVITVEFASWDECTVSIFEAGAEKWERTKLKTDRDVMFASEDREFLKMVADGSATTCDIHEAARSVRIIMEAQK